KTAGTWVSRVADGKGGSTATAIGTADDYDDADGVTILDIWQAQSRALAAAPGRRSTPAVTIAEALNRYEHELRIRGADVNKVARVRKHLPDALARKNVALLRPDDLRRWRNELIAELAPATVNRTSSMLRAACNLAAVNDDRITNQHAWRSGLAGIPDVEL